MKWIILVRPAAERDMNDARDWYKQRKPGLGGDFLDEIAAVIRVLEKNPEQYPLYYRRFRRALLKRFPYKLFYQVIGQRVLVFRVLHAKQDHRVRLAEP